MTDPLAFLAEVEGDTTDNIQDLYWSTLKSKKLVFSYSNFLVINDIKSDIELILVLSRPEKRADLSDEIPKLIKEGLKNYEVTNLEEFLDLKFQESPLSKLMYGNYTSSYYKHLSFLGVASNGENQGFYTPERFKEIPHISKRWLALAIKTKFGAY